MAEELTWTPATLVAHAGGPPDEVTGAFVPPIQFATTFERDADNGYSRGRVYARPDNPTYDAPEALMARLEGGEAALLFSSGLAAATSVFMALRPGDHVLAPRAMYWALRHWLKTFCAEWGLQAEFYDNDNAEDLNRRLRAGTTKLVWVETPANPTWAVTDIAAAATAAHAAGALLCVDNTVPTPILTRPLTLGADLVMHSGTKYLNGHDDVVAGVLVTGERSPIWTRITNHRRETGGVLGSMEAWLLLRGMRTLAIRVARASSSAQRLAEFLADHPKIERVRYPGLRTDAGHAVAARQMRGGFGGMLSVDVGGGEAGALRAAAAFKIWTRATSLGGPESLAEHRASVEGPDSPAGPGLLRLSVGLEDPAELMADFDQALAKV